VADILVIEDEATMRDLLEKFMVLMGYRVHFAQDGREGLNMLKNENSYKAVLTDIGMPDVDGHDVIRHIRSSEKSHIPVVAITGLNESQLENNQFDLVLQKPFSLEQLKSALESMIPL
jgi:CheY-like chemotaxis protein